MSPRENGILTTIFESDYMNEFRLQPDFGEPGFFFTEVAKIDPVVQEFVETMSQKFHEETAQRIDFVMKNLLLWKEWVKVASYYGSYSIEIEQRDHSVKTLNKMDNNFHDLSIWLPAFLHPSHNAGYFCRTGDCCGQLKMRHIDNENVITIASGELIDYLNIATYDTVSHYVSVHCYYCEAEIFAWAVIVGFIFCNEIGSRDARVTISSGDSGHTAILV